MLYKHGYAKFPTHGKGLIKFYRHTMAHSHGRRLEFQKGLKTSFTEYYELYKLLHAFYY